MPFEQLIPRPFTSNGVRMYAPAASSVYGISNAREWIYLGETEDIQAALLAHLQKSWQLVDGTATYRVCVRGQQRTVSIDAAGPAGSRVRALL